MTQCGVIHNADASAWTSYLINILKENNADQGGDTIHTMAHEDTDVLTHPHSDTITFFNDPKWAAY